MQDMSKEPNLPLANRRDLLKRSALGLGSLALIGVLGDDQQLKRATSKDITATSMKARPSHFAGRAKRVIHFFLNGGPSHVDTFDPKPNLLKYAGKPLPQTLRTERKTGAAFPSPFEFKRYGESGIEVSELFSRTASHIDDIAVIRSMHAEVPNHEPSLMLMNCGDSVQSRPSLGSWLLYGLGTENQNLPGFIAMCPGGLPIKDNENWQSAFLPGTFQGTYIDSKHTDFNRLIENIEHPQIATAQQRKQLNLLEKWNRAHQENRIDERLDSRIASYELAFRMQHDARDAFDTTDEPQYIKEMYGNGVHGRQTLIYAAALLNAGFDTSNCGIMPDNRGTTMTRSKITTASSPTKLTNPSPPC